MTITVAIMLFSVIGHAQTFKAMFLNPNVYRTRIDLKAVRVMHKDLKTIYNDSCLISVKELGYLDYKIVSEDENGHVVFRLLPKVKLVEEMVAGGSGKTANVVKHITDKQYKNEEDNAYNFYFAIKKDAFKPLGKTLLSTKIIGVPLIHPLKLRPSKGAEGWNLAGEFTASYNFGLRFKLGKNPFSQNYLSIIPYGFGLGAAKYFRENPDHTLTEKSDSFAVTYFQTGLLFTLQKVNFGIFAGKDAMIDKQKDWVYQGKSWFSFGLGYKFKND